MVDDAKSDYQKQLDAFMAEEFKKENPKPNSMAGSLGWYAKKKKEFDEKLKKKQHE